MNFNLNELQLKSVFYHFNDKIILDNMTLDFKGPCAVYLFGKNGSGKSTLLKLIAQVLQPSFGEIFWNGQALEKNKSVISYVPQYLKAFDSFFVEDFIHFFSKEKKIKFTKEISDDWIHKFELKSLLRKSILELSGGEWKRVQVARALMQSPQILILDEIDSDLDYAYKGKLLNIIQKYIYEKKAVVYFASHDIKFGSQLLTHAIAIENGKAMWTGSGSEFWNLGIFSKVMQISKRFERI